MCKCIICGHQSEFFFIKKFQDFDLGAVDYHKCTNCGFVFSKKHQEMSHCDWKKLNIDFHENLENNKKEKMYNQPPYIQQSLLLHILNHNNILNINNCVDWGSGYGTLSKLLKRYYNISINNYDKYMESDYNRISSDEIVNRKFATLINSAVFEHVTAREQLDEINSCVSEDGNFVFHTFVSENVPKDPQWFYLLPVHCAFHTNKSMGILMEQWGYKSSIYCPTSRMWVLLKKDVANVEQRVKLINEEMHAEYLYLNNGFVDYWK